MREEAKAPRRITFAELTRAIAAIKRQRTDLRMKRMHSDLQLEKPRRDVSTQPTAVRAEPCLTTFDASRDDALPRRLLHSAYDVDPDSREDILSWLRLGFELLSRPTRRNATTTQLRYALPETLCWLQPMGLISPVSRLDLGEWRVDLEDTRETLVQLEDSVTELSFAPATREGVRTTLTPWYRCRCSAQACSVSEDCRLSASGSLFGSAVADAVLATVATTLPSGQLRRIDLAHCAQITVSGLTAILRAFGTSLEALDLSGCARLDDVGGRVLAAKAMTSLTSLSLNGWTRLSDNGLAAIVQACPRLLALELSRCERLTDFGVRAILDYCSDISALRLGGCSQLGGECFTDVPKASFDAGNDGYEGQVALVRVRPMLTRLDLGECAMLRRPVLRWIATCSPKLTDVRIAGCIVDDEGLRALAMTPGLRLRSLDVSGCAMLCADGGAAFAILARNQGDTLEHLDVRRVMRLCPAAISALFACPRLLTLRLDHVPGADEIAFGGTAAVAAALEKADAIVATMQLPSSLAANSISLPSPKRSLTTRQTMSRRHSGKQAARRRCQLLMLTLSECSKLSDGVVACLAPRLPYLVVLDLSHAGAGGAMTDASMCAVANHCQSPARLGRRTTCPDARDESRRCISRLLDRDCALRVGKQAAQA